jgi:fermentation-respiration switch protein FrsA (DUF1100 family)
VAIDLASRRPHQNVCVVKSFTSAPDVGGQWFPWIPCRLIMRNQFRSIDKIGKIKNPVFIAHGDRDEVIPYSQGAELFNAANEPKQFLSLPGNRHNDPLPDNFFPTMIEFFKANVRVTPAS